MHPGAKRSFPERRPTLVEMDVSAANARPSERYSPEWTPSERSISVRGQFIPRGDPVVKGLDIQ